jgi:hypothetical protein
MIQGLTKQKPSLRAVKNPGGNIANRGGRDDSDKNIPDIWYENCNSESQVYFTNFV